MGKPIDNPDRIKLDPIMPIAKDRITGGTINASAFDTLRYQSQLTLHCGYQILFETPMPNRFWRAMQWVLLGWKWENL